MGLRAYFYTGYEAVLWQTPHIRASCRISLQFHDKKQETILLLRGRAILLCENAQGELEESEMIVDYGYSNLPGQRHRLFALEDSDFVEASTPEASTTYRLEDDSSRSHETESLRAQDRGHVTI